MEPAEAVLRFLAGVGPGSEAELYLRLFRSRARESFAAIVVDAQTMQENAEGVAFDLRLLGALELTPVVVLGLFEPAQAADHARKLQKLLSDSGVPSQTLPITSPPSAIAAAAVSGAVPIVQAGGADDDARQVELARMLTGLRTHKLIFLRSDGGLRVNGEPLSVVNLSDEFGALMQRPNMPDSHKAVLACSRRLVLELTSHDLQVAVTSPLTLLHELFTVKGAGTFLRKGARILRYEGLAAVDLDRLRTLLVDSFGKSPSPAVFTRPLLHCYVEESYRGAALVAPCPLGAYLSKFAVTRQAQGEGVGRDLWQTMTADHPVLVWRARPGNPIRSWYEKQCDGRVRAGQNGEWIVFFRGLAPEQIPDAVSFSLAQPVDF
ncbi:MAG TPA: hypothetical protein VHM19_14835 [Polyangiales bacterium]|jgi:acetylglutamate kinase|nr:hypothetical protein [Polyangiales bacterium]